MTDTSEFRTIVAAHQQRAFRAALRVVGDPDEALDVTQEAFLALHLHRSSIPHNAIAPWLERVATNAAIDRVRRRRNTAEHDPDQEPSGPDPSAEVVRHEERRLLLDALRELPGRQQEVVSMRVVDQLTFREIHRALGISDGAAKLHFRRGVQTLTEQFRRIRREGRS